MPDVLCSARLAALLTVALPHGYTAAHRARPDTALGLTYHDVTISPPAVDAGTFTFGIAGAYAHIQVDDDGSYLVGIFATDVAYTVQSAGRVLRFTDPRQVVDCALSQIRGHLTSQQRGW